MLSPKIKQTRRARSKSMVLGELSRLSRPSSPLDQERALKSGWLKRQRSIMKNWQLRWFVLRTEALYFYKDQEESKAQGCIPLHGSQVNELPANQDEPARHLFEMVPGGGGEKERTALSPESFLLMANSQSDMEDWVRAIRRAIWAPLGGGVFGQHLEETMMCEVQCGPHRLVPGLVEQCVAFIRQQGLEEEGLFRAPGQTNHVRELQDTFDRGEKPVMDSATDVHTVASLLKLYLRELPEPVIPFSKYTQFLSCAQFLIKDKETGIQELIKQVRALPQVNYNLLKYICKFLDEVQSHSTGNKMSVQNLATVFGPNILRPRVEDPITMMEGSSHVQHLMTVLISEHSRLYQRAEPDIRTTASPLEVQQSPGQRCMVAWQSQEDMDPLPCSSPASGPILPAEEPRPALAAREPSPETKPSVNTSQETNNKEEEEGQLEQKSIGKATGKIEEKAEGKSGGGAALSPSKQSKGLPAWKCSLKGGATAGSGGAKGKLGGSAGDVSAVSGGNWLMNGLSSLRVHRRTASSGERLKDSTLSLKESTLSLKEASLRNARKDSLEESQSANNSSLSNRTTPSHRLSAYDNVTATPSSLNTPPESSSLWTSCEIPLDDLAGSDPGLGSEVVMLSAQDEHSEAGDSSDQFDRCVSSTGCNEAEPGEDTLQGQGSGRNEGLTSRVAELKQELKRQKITYDTSIRKLEDSCSRYQLQLSQLEEDLYQEKKKFHMLGIRLRNSERARQDAESRNTALQKEMEEFFKTLGDLTTGAPQTN